MGSAGRRMYPRRTFDVDRKKSLAPTPTSIPQPRQGASPDPDRLYDRSYILAIVVQTLATLANAILAHYARWIQFLDGTVSDVGWIIGIGALSGVFLRPWLGQLINRIGARHTWALGCLVFASGSIGSLFLHQLDWRIYFFRSCIVVGAALAFASSLTYVTQRYPIHRRTEAIGILGAGGFVGMMFGPLIGDLLLSAEERTRGDFAALFVTAGVAIVIPIVLIALMEPRPPDNRSTPVRLREFILTIRRHWPGTILLVCVVFGMCMTVPFGFLTAYIDEVGLATFAPSPVAIFYLSYAIWGLVLRVGMRRVPDRRGRRKVLISGLVLMSAGMFCFRLVDPTNGWWLVVPGLICGSGHSFIYHTMTALSLDRFPDEVRGTGSSLSLMALELGFVAGAPPLGLIAKHFGYPALFTTVGCACSVAAAIYTAVTIPIWRERWQARRAESTSH